MAARGVHFALSKLDRKRLLAIFGERRLDGGEGEAPARERDERRSRDAPRVCRLLDGGARA